MNVIIERIADFLKESQPFNTLTDQELIEIASSIRVISLEKNKTLFKVNDILHQFFYVVASGTINLSIISDAEETLLNKCHIGDVFGLRPFFARNNYMMTATAREDSIIYAIPIQIFKPLLAKNTEVLDFLLESFASTSTSSKDNAKNNITDSVNYTDNQTDIQYFQTFEYSKNPISVQASQTIQNVAKIMTENIMDNVIISSNNKPIGIVTDKDFRSKIATGRFSIETTIDKIMSFPVITVPENLSLAEAQLIMLKHNVTHLCVTDDGTNNSIIKGIISEHDLVVAQANNPGVLIKRIKRSNSAKDLKIVREKLSELVQNSISKNISLAHINMISGEITFAIIRRAIELAILDLGSPPVRFCWLSIGSQGRKEQVLYTDQDSFLVFEDVLPEKYRDVKDYFLKLAKRVTTTLEKVGFEACPFGHMGSSILWCKSLSDWKKQYLIWITNPGDKSSEISSIFFDYDYIFGDILLEEAISDEIFKTKKSNSLLYDYLGNEALKHPAPLNFFKKFNVEEDGEFKNKFDIKSKSLMPLIDAARLLALSHNLKGINNTYLRFKQLAIVEPKFAELYRNCAEAFLLLSKFRVVEGVNNDSSGQYINLETVSKSDKERIKNALLPMKDLEEVIKDKFQLTHFS